MIPQVILEAITAELVHEASLHELSLVVSMETVSPHAYRLPGDTSLEEAVDQVYLTAREEGFCPILIKASGERSPFFRN